MKLTQKQYDEIQNKVYDAMNGVLEECTSELNSELTEDEEERFCSLRAEFTSLIVDKIENHA